MKRKGVLLVKGDVKGIAEQLNPVVGGRCLGRLLLLLLLARPGGASAYTTEYTLEFLPEVSSSQASIDVTAAVGPLTDVRSYATDKYSFSLYDDDMAITDPDGLVIDYLTWARVRHIDYSDPNYNNRVSSSQMCVSPTTVLDSDRSYTWWYSIVKMTSAGDSSFAYGCRGHVLYSHAVDLNWRITLPAPGWDYGNPRLELRIEENGWPLSSPGWGTEANPDLVGMLMVRNCTVTVGETHWGPFSWQVFTDTREVSGMRPPSFLDVTAAYGDQVRFTAEISFAATFGSPVASWSSYSNFGECLSLRINRYYSAVSVSLRDRADPARVVDGAAADGESRIEIRVSGLSDDIDVSDVLIEIPEFGGHMEPDAQVTDGVFTQTYCAPKFFVRPLYPEDLTADQRLVEWRLCIDGGESQPPPIRLMKPAVLLLYGLWSSVEKWDNLTARLLAAGYRMVEAPSYPNARHLNENMYIVNGNLKAILRNYQDRYNIVARKADVVAYSMGGVLTKLFGYPSLIRSVVTIGTPHHGSPFADLICGIWDMPVIGAAWARVMASFGTPLSGGIRDLQELERRYSLDVPSLAIVGNVWLDDQDPLEPLFADFLLKGLKALGMMPIDAAIHDLHEFIYGPGVASDWIVPTASQKGRVSRWSEFREWHCGECHNEEILDACIQFLQADGDFGWYGSQPASADRAPAENKLPLREVSQSPGQIEIIRPEEGQVFACGETVTVEAGVSSPDALVFFSTSTGGYELVADAPYIYQFVLPERLAGTVEITVLASDSQGFIGFEGVSVNVAAGDHEIFALRAYPRKDYLTLNVGATVPLKVVGVFAGGFECDITSAEWGTTYSSSAPEVAEVSGDGVISVKNPGEANVTVENGDFSWTYLVTGSRFLEKGDLDYDDSVDISDVMLCLRMVGGLPITVGGQAYEPLEGYPEWLAGMADMNGDGVVDISDAVLIYRKSIGLDP